MLWAQDLADVAPKLALNGPRKWLRAVVTVEDMSCCENIDACVRTDAGTFDAEAFRNEKICRETLEAASVQLIPKKFLDFIHSRKSLS